MKDKLEAKVGINLIEILRRYFSFEVAHCQSKLDKMQMLIFSLWLKHNAVPGAGRGGGETKLIS